MRYCHAVSNRPRILKAGLPCGFRLSIASSASPFGGVPTALRATEVCRSRPENCRAPRRPGHERGRQPRRPEKPHRPRECRARPARREVLAADLVLLAFRGTAFAGELFARPFFRTGFVEIGGNFFAPRAAAGAFAADLGDDFTLRSSRLPGAAAFDARIVPSVRFFAETARVAGSGGFRCIGRSAVGRRDRGDGFRVAATGKLATKDFAFATSRARYATIVGRGILVNLSRFAGAAGISEIAGAASAGGLDPAAGDERTARLSDVAALRSTMRI